MFRSVAAYVPQGATGLALGIVNEIFGRPPFDFAFCAAQAGPVRTDLGAPVEVGHGLDRLVAADLVLMLPSVEFRDDPPATVRTAVRAAYDRGALVAAHCVGVFGLAATGLLDDRAVTTHWRFARELAERHGSLRLRPEALYVDEGRIVTGAGAAAGIDLYLHLIRREHGSALATALARELVSPPHRDGGQLQFVTAPVPADPDDERLAAALAWATERLDERISVAELAGRALLSPRTFARRFVAATGTTPHAWLRTQRLNRAEQLLETTDLPVEEIARRVGYSSAAVLREQFTERRGVAPRDYRRAFASRSAQAG